MLNKLRAMWRIFWAYEYFVLADNSLTASYKKTDNHAMIRMLSEQMVEAHNKQAPIK